MEVDLLRSLWNALTVRCLMFFLQRFSYRIGNVSFFMGELFVSGEANMKQYGFEITRDIHECLY